ncbi:uncharacterized protein BDZ99DRAFT_533175, partial [Mytilinidion resinicola]
DVDERGQQVLRMGAVYRRGEGTVAWVGGRAYEDEGVVDLIEKIAAKAEDEGSRRRIRHGRDFETLTHFLMHPYWYRVWFIQELALSREIVILAGRKQTTWDKIQEGVPCLKRKSSATLHLDDLEKLRRDARESKPIRLLEALFRSWVALASDSHDRIFALFGLTYDDSIYVSHPNYSTPVADLWQAMTVSALGWTKDLDTIVFLGNDSGDFKEPT